MSDPYKLIDIATINVKAGTGGDGKVSFRRAKFIPKGGPDGGDGGKGGDVYFVSTNNMATLLDFRSKPSYQAEEGQEGGKQKMFGKDGNDLKIKVPVGTLIYEIKNGREILVADMTNPGKEFCIARGGKGGKGNTHFKSSTNQAPRQFTYGDPGEDKQIKLEIKLVADVGLVGYPNAGKSTLLNYLTKANAKVANYPFTTLSPNLGTYILKNGRQIVLSDIPGLIDGASDGKGLGDEFLRHIERTKMIIHLIDPLFFNDSVDVTPGAPDETDLITRAVSMYQAIRKELSQYGHGLDQKPEVIAINKSDLAEISDIKDLFIKQFSEMGLPVHIISAATGDGIEDLMTEVLGMLNTIPAQIFIEDTEPVKLFNITNLPNKRMVFGYSNVGEKEFVKTVD